MNKIIMITSLALLLCACKSQAEVKAEWIKFCTDGEFTVKQCEVLYSLKQSSDQASNDAAMAAGMGAASIGIAAGKR